MFLIILILNFDCVFVFLLYELFNSNSRKPRLLKRVDGQTKLIAKVKGQKKQNFDLKLNEEMVLIFNYFENN